MGAGHTQTTSELDILSPTPLNSKLEGGALRWVAKAIMRRI
jgi:hypothetical protein